MTDPELWKANVARYFEDLGDYRADVLVRAFETAWRSHTVFFPSLAELDIACRVAVKDLASNRPRLPEPSFERTPESRAAARQAAEYVRKALGGDVDEGALEDTVSPEPDESKATP